MTWNRKMYMILEDLIKILSSSIYDKGFTLIALKTISNFIDDWVIEIEEDMEED